MAYYYLTWSTILISGETFLMNGGGASMALLVAQLATYLLHLGSNPRQAISERCFFVYLQT